MNYVKKLVEMEWNRELSYCCGAGGGFRKAWPELSRAISKERIKMAKETNADALVVEAVRSVPTT